MKKSVSPKLLKLKILLQDSKIEKTHPFTQKKNSQEIPFVSFNQTHSDSVNQLVDSVLKKETLSPLRLVKKPVNLLFSLDQFVFEFSKKMYYQKRTSDFLKQLQERKKFSLFYGNLTRKQLFNLLKHTKTKKGYFSKNLFSFLERRLDVVIYRSGFVRTLFQARQCILHKKVLVNQQIQTLSSFRLSPGDVISLTPETAKEFHETFFHLTGESTVRIPKGFQHPHPESVAQFKKKIKNLNSIDIFFSKSFCKQFLQFLCTRIKLRTFWNFKKEDLKIIHLEKEKSTFLNEREPSFLTFFKWKWKSRIHKRKSKKNDNGNHFFVPTLNQRELQEKGTFSFFEKKKMHFLVEKGFLPKKPLFWNQKVLNFNPQKFLKSQLFKKTQFSSFFSPQKKRVLKKESFLRTGQAFQKSRTALVLQKKMKGALSRKSFLVFLKHLENSHVFTRLLTLNFQKFFSKKLSPNSAEKGFSRAHFTKILNFRLVRPLHFEISYKLFTLLYLSSPQRVNFPFLLNLEKLKSSLR